MLAPHALVRANHTKPIAIPYQQHRQKSIQESRLRHDREVCLLSLQLFVYCCTTMIFYYYHPKVGM
jgi:hypothetical protein